MPTFIFIAGAPGSGKSTVAHDLQERLGTPLFEFGWIPEFRNTGISTISYTEDEALAFENLVLVLKNYAKHGFKNIIVTDLENKRIEQLAKIFEGFNYSIFTLRIRDVETLKSRVLDESRSSGYRDWKTALGINHTLHDREAYMNETFIDADNHTVDEITGTILRHVNQHS